MKIGFKLSLIMAALGLFAIASVSITLLARARSSILNISKKYSVSMANDSAADITNFLNTYLYKVETGAHVMEQYRYIVMANRRNVLNAVLEGLARSNPEIIAAWCVWEPDVLEGGDLEYLGTKGAGPGGRFSPYYYWENGKVELAVMDDFEDPAYILPKKTGSHTVLDPYEFPVGRKTVLMTTVAVPITTDGKVVGVIGFDLPLDTIQRISQTQKPYPDAIAAVFSSNGTITGHPDERRIGKDMMKTEADMAGEYLPDFANAVKAGRPYTFTRYMDEADSNMIIFSVPITAGKVKTPWSYALAITEHTVMAPVYEMLYITILISAVVLLIVVAAGIILSRTISKPIVKVADTLKDISEGEGDLTRSIDVTSKDEIGSLALYFNNTLAKIKQLVLTIKTEAAGLHNIGNTLSSNMSQTAAAVNQITATIRNIRGRVINQSASVSETHATMEQVVANINKLNIHVESQSGSVSQASSAIEEMAANIRAVNDTLVKNAANVDTLKESSEAGRGGLEEVAADIREIAHDSEGLLEINSVMKNIASQTNLLSMNAAIEAAHAGDAGMGFAVVADEIRKLAENSSDQSRTIGKILKKIKSSIDKITASTESVLAKFEAIDVNVKTVAEQSDTISGAMKEQGEGSRQMLQSAGNLNEITRQVKSGAKEMLEGSREVILESGNLEKATQEITSGINEMAGGADQINVAVNQVNEISAQNRESINKLLNEVSRFKVE